MNENRKETHEKRGRNAHVSAPDDGKSLATLLIEHDEKKILPFHMPGHKRAPFDFLFGAQKTDITEIDGFDNLHDARGVLKDAQERASALYRTLHTRFLVNGSTCGILAGIRALTKPGDKVLIARNCHKSVFNAVELCALRPVYVEPAYFPEYGFYGSVTPQSVNCAFEKNPDVRLVVVTSPTYEGVISDVKGISEICHLHGAALFVDEAHGAHLGLCKEFENSARTLGADIVVNSLHKTLPSLTQTALLHVCSERADIKEIDANLAVFETSSPSYVLMASIDGCVRFLQNQGASALETWSDDIDFARNALSKLEKITLFNPATDNRIFGYDKTKFLLLCTAIAESGVRLKDLLRKEYDIELEMASENYAVAMSGLGDDKAAFERLCNALFALDKRLARGNRIVCESKPEIPKKAFEPYQIKGSDVEYVDFDKSEGRICAENVWAYPPGCPLIVKGEKISADFARRATLLHESGVNVTGETREFPAKILVVR